MGFRNDMEYILNHKQKDEAHDAASTQTLLFSATLPKDLRSIMASHMRRDYLTVDCVHDVDPATHTNANVDQSYITLPTVSSAELSSDISNSPDPYSSEQRLSNSRWISGLVSILEDIMLVENPKEYKVVVFFPTTAMCQFFSKVFHTVFKIPVMEIHSKKTQANRTRVSDKFRAYKKGVLFTTDVSARGVDYPNVSWKCELLYICSRLWAPNLTS